MELNETITQVVLNESRSRMKKVDKSFEKDVALATLQVLKDEMFSEMFRLTDFQREKIQRITGERLPDYVPRSRGPGAMIGDLVRNLVKGDNRIYIDGRTSLVKGEKTVMELTPTTKWSDIAKALKIKI